MPSIIQAAFIFETLVNIPAIVSLLFYPESTIRPALAANVPLSFAKLNRIATLLARCAGILILALTPQLLLALPDSKDCAGKRKQVYVRHFSGPSSLVRDSFLFYVSSGVAKERSTHITIYFTTKTPLIPHNLIND